MGKFILSPVCLKKQQAKRSKQNKNPSVKKKKEEEKRKNKDEKREYFEFDYENNGASFPVSSPHIPGPSANDHFQAGLDRS